MTADKNLKKTEELKCKIYDVNNHKKSNPDEDRVIYRLTIDMRAINSATKNNTSIVLPGKETIECSFHNCII